MIMDADNMNKELNADELENINGGLQAGNLLYTGKEAQTTTSTLFKGKKKKAANLLFKDESKLEGKELSGDVLEKKTFC